MRDKNFLTRKKRESRRNCALLEVVGAPVEWANLIGIKVSFMACELAARSNYDILSVGYYSASTFNGGLLSMKNEYICIQKRNLKHKPLY